jgi:hypothetical protein
MDLKYGDWVYWLTRKWEYSGKDKLELIGFAVLLASFGDNGIDCYPTIETLVRLGNVSERTAQRRKARCVELGLFEDTGKTYKGVPKLRISIPADDEDPIRPDCENPAICDCRECTEWRRRYVARSEFQKRELVKRAAERQDKPSATSADDGWHPGWLSAA